MLESASALVVNDHMFIQSSWYRALAVLLVSFAVLLVLDNRVIDGKNTLNTPKYTQYILRDPNTPTAAGIARFSVCDILDNRVIHGHGLSFLSEIWPR